MASDASPLWTSIDAGQGGSHQEVELRLLGDVKGKRVLELGCGTARYSIGFAKQGATAIGIDASSDALGVARYLCEREEARVELRQGDPADLAFLRAESIDAAFSSRALAAVEDMDRLFRQVHRVLKPGGPLVFSIPHPVSRVVGPDAGAPPLVRRSYFDRAPVEVRTNGTSSLEYQHTVGDVHGGLTRAGYRVDALVEPEPDHGPLLPATLVVRARKEGT
ncbi:MAG TPA: class I SAM-dependent methyltransferase [Acidimicrobiales bacterium]|nr:class I SAM-dependent methyltransferase [Acidimicrobiales bacterium]